MITEVLDMNTGDKTTYTLNPFQAVIAAYAQRERQDYNTWDYHTKYSHLLTVAESARKGWEVITCGNQTALRDKSVGAHGWPLKPGGNGEPALHCPKCGHDDITMGVQYPVHGTGPMGRGRLGDFGSRETIKCNSCGHSEVSA